MRKKPAVLSVPLSVPLRRKEEFSLFKVSDNECKVKISPQLLLATQRFLSRGEDAYPSSGPLPSRPSKQESVQEQLCAPLGCPGSRHPSGHSGHPRGPLRSPHIQKQGQAEATCAGLRQEAWAVVCVAASPLVMGGTRLEGRPGDCRWAAGVGG